MTIAVIVATYGSSAWEQMANSRPYPSTHSQGMDELIMWHETDATRATSLNNAADRAESDWLLFVDADDELAPGYVGAMRRAVEQHPPPRKVLFTPAVQWVRRGRPHPPAFQTEVPLERGNWLVIGTMINRQFFLDLGGFHEHPHGLEDWNLWARAVRAGATIVKVPEAVYVAHVNPQSEHHKLFRDKRVFRAAYEAARADAWG